MAEQKQETPPRVWLWSDLRDFGFQKTSEDDVPYVPESELARVRRYNRILREALERAHSCATLRADGTCDGCFVSEALIHARDESEGQDE